MLVVHIISSSLFFLLRCFTVFKYGADQQHFVLNS